ncbi:MAG: NAD(P)-binding protein, partial [Deltaproteobacteria bacterium]|nr:NAD(P)-binding protein [Deltaproteobacteria bacterium]
MLRAARGGLVKVAVVGAGIAGLTAAYRLQGAGHEVEVLEATARPGGRMSSTRIASLPVDLGAHVLLASFERTRALAAEVGLGGEWFELEEGREGGVLHGDEVTSFSPRNAFDLLRYRGLSLTARLRLLVSFLHVRRHHLDLDFLDLSAGDATIDDEDCESYS